jgi:hypothetical protein
MGAPARAERVALIGPIGSNLPLRGGAYAPGRTSRRSTRSTMTAPLIEAVNAIDNDRAAR